MRIIESIAMANGKKNAEHFVTTQLPQVLDNLIKIWLFQTTSQLEREWIDEMSHKHLAPMFLVINNTKTKKGHLEKGTVLNVWNEIVTEKFLQYLVRINSKAQKYVKLQQRHTQ